MSICRDFSRNDVGWRVALLEVRPQVFQTDAVMLPVDLRFTSAQLAKLFGKIVHLSRSRSVSVTIIQVCCMFNVHFPQRTLDCHRTKMLVVAVWVVADPSSSFILTPRFVGIYDVGIRA